MGIKPRAVPDEAGTARPTPPLDRDALLAAARALARAGKRAAPRLAVEVLGRIALPRYPDEPVDPAELDGAQRGALTALAANGAAWAEPAIPEVLRDLGLVSPDAAPRPAAARRELLALLAIVPPRLTDRWLPVEIADGVKKYWPLKHCLRAASPQPHLAPGDDRPPPLPRERLLAAIVRHFSAGDAVAIAVEACELRTAYGWARDGAALVELCLDLVACYPDYKIVGELLDQARRLTAEVHPYDNRTPVFLVAALTAILERMHRPLDDAFDRLVGIALVCGENRAQVRAALARLEPERRAAILAGVIRDRAYLVRGPATPARDAPFFALDCLDLAPRTDELARELERLGAAGVNAAPPG